MLLVLLYMAAVAAGAYFNKDFIVANPSKAIILGILALFGLVIVNDISKIPRRMLARKQLAHLTGEATGHVTSHYEDTYEVWDEERGSYDRRSRGTVVSYQFEVNGQTYTGQGYGSWALKDREYQQVYYDPKNPGDNCTKAHYKNVTQSHLISSLIYMAIAVAIMYGIMQLIIWGMHR